MQGSATINREALSDLTKTVFEGIKPNIYTAYSEYEQEIMEFESPDKLNDYITKSRKSGESLLMFAIWYTNTNGHIDIKKIELNPKKCNGYKFRYSIGGWGIIQLQCDFKREPDINCRIAVNTEKRAQKWKDTYPNLGDPDLWDWNAVEKHARRLIRRMKKYV
jgi:hypothetical protein